MVKKTPTSSVALPGTVTSMTAHGYLPQYGGHAAASLSPVMANSPHSPRSSAAKANDESPGKRENMHPGQIDGHGVTAARHEVRRHGMASG
jgi:hypothetical protein